MRELSILALSCVTQLASAGSWCADSYWTGQCTLCPGFWYQTCRNGYADHADRGCGFWSAGCETQCRNAQHSYNDGCGCGAGTACLNVDCAVSSWSAYGPCSNTCGDGTQTRTRTITRNQAYSGDACPMLSESQPCNDRECPVDCVVSDFGNWSGCSETCGDGTKTRTRSITQEALHGGAECPDLEETMTCNDGPCAIDCEVSDWVSGSCSETCGEGTMTRTRDITQEPLHGGAECPDLSETVACNEVECPVDCEVTEFGEWGECSVSCDPGQQTRSRTITQESLHGGAECPELTESRDCPEQLACDCTTEAAYAARCAWPRLTAEPRTCTQKYGCDFSDDGEIAACVPYVNEGRKKPVKVKCKKLEKSVCACFSSCRLKTKKGKTRCKGVIRFN